jgi:NAD(P)-dependent dehydrogenase (short-subunit alcohol dehydrogenase family)
MAMQFASALPVSANAVCFLVSERASYVNGAALVVDGSKSLVI